MFVSRNSQEVCNVQFLIFLFKSSSTRVITTVMFFLRFNFFVILRWYPKRQDPRICPGTIAVKDWATVTRNSQIWHVACSWSFDFNLLKLHVLFMLIFHAGLRGVGSKNFQNSSYKENTAGWSRVSRLSFRLL